MLTLDQLHTLAHISALLRGAGMDTGMLVAFRNASAIVEAADGEPDDVATTFSAVNAATREVLEAMGYHPTEPN